MVALISLWVLQRNSSKGATVGWAGIWVSAYGDGVSMLSTILKEIYDNIKTNDNFISR